MITRSFIIYISTMEIYILLTHWGRGTMAAIFQMTFSNAFSWMKMSGFRLRFPKGPINNISALVQIMAWCHPGDKPLSEPMMVNLLMHICVTRPQWLKRAASSSNDHCSLKDVNISDYVIFLNFLSQRSNALITWFTAVYVFFVFLLWNVIYHSQIYKNLARLIMVCNGCDEQCLVIFLHLNKTPKSLPKTKT